jgi:RNA polymerase sigma-70 factor (ECF subfamily)
MHAFRRFRAGCTRRTGDGRAAGFGIAGPARVGQAGVRLPDVGPAGVRLSGAGPAGARMSDEAAPGTRRLGARSLGIPALGAPATGTPATGTPATGTPATGTPAPGTASPAVPMAGMLKRSSSDACLPDRSSRPSGHGDADAAILAIAASGDRQAFAALFRHFAPRVKAYLRQLGLPPALAEELAQETLLSVWRRAASFDPARAGAATWIFTIARNLGIDALRRTRPSAGEPGEDLPCDAPAADALLVAGEAEAALLAALGRLPAEQLQVVQMSYFRGLAHGEIERELGVPLGTVKSRLRLAMARLRAALGAAT